MILFLIGGENMESKTTLTNDTDKPMLIFNITWMKEYRDKTTNDKPVGGGRHVEKNREGGEMWNFFVEEDQENSMCYGFGMTQNSRGRYLNGNEKYFSGVDLKRLVSNTKKWEEGESEGNIDVVFISTPKNATGKKVVGWYEGATVFHKYYRTHPKRRHYGYLCEVKAENAVLLLEEERMLIPPALPLKMRTFRYLDGKENAKLRKWLRKKFIEKQKPDKKSGAGKKRYGEPLSAEKRREIENSAVAKVTEYYESKEYEVKSVETDNVGWDLDVSKDGEILRVEVKGHKGDVIQFELTPNEYEQMQVQKKYRVCVVCQALEKSPRLIELFPVLEDKWTLQTKDGKKIVELEERTAARVIRQQ